MTYLKYFAETDVDRLAKEIPDHLDWYDAPTRQPPSTWVDEGSLKLTTIECAEPGLQLKVAKSRPELTDVQYAQHVHEALKELSPRQAADARLWAYLCHFECPRYVAWRWPYRRSRRTKISEKQARAIHVRNHFFAYGQRAIMRDNALSRLWWLGHIAENVAPGEAQKFLEIILHKQDVRSSVLERPGVSMNLRVLERIYRVMESEWDAEGQGAQAALFQRETCREWMKRLNRRGGVVLLDALPEKELTRIVTDEAEAAIAAQVA